MRSWAVALVAALMLFAGREGVAPNSPHLTWLGEPDAAFASSGTVRFSPMPRITAWNATQMTIDLQAQSMVTTTQCSTNPQNPTAPTAPCGVGGFELTVEWDATKFNYVNIVGASFLSQTGRSQTCFTPVVVANTAKIQCVSFGNPSTPGLPLGPQGGGPMATLYLDPIGPSCCPLIPINYAEAVMVDIQGNPFPGTPQAGSIQYAPCADVNATGTVDLQDTVQILNRFGSSSPPQHPKYNPTGPVLGDISIDLQDALYSLIEFGQACVYT